MSPGERLLHIVACVVVAGCLVGCRDSNTHPRADGNAPAVARAVTSQGPLSTLETESASCRSFDVLGPGTASEFGGILDRGLVISQGDAALRSEVIRDLSSFVSYYVAPSESSMNASLEPDKRRLDPGKEAALGQLLLQDAPPGGAPPGGTAELLRLALERMRERAAGENSPERTLVSIGLPDDAVSIVEMPRSAPDALHDVGLGGRATGEEVMKARTVFDLAGALSNPRVTGDTVKALTFHFVLRWFDGSGGRGREHFEFVSAKFFREESLGRWFPTAIVVRGEPRPAVVI